MLIELLRLLIALCIVLIGYAFVVVFIVVTMAVGIPIVLLWYCWEKVRGWWQRKNRKKELLNG